MCWVLQTWQKYPVQLAGSRCLGSCFPERAGQDAPHCSLFPVLLKYPCQRLHGCLSRTRCYLHLNRKFEQQLQHSGLKTQHVFHLNRGRNYMLLLGNRENSNRLIANKNAVLEVKSWSLKQLLIMLNPCRTKKGIFSLKCLSLYIFFNLYPSSKAYRVFPIIFRSRDTSDSDPEATSSSEVCSLCHL